MSSLCTFNARETAIELTARVHHGALSAFVDLEYGQNAVNAMCSIREFAKSVTRSDVKPFSLRKERGVDELKSNAVGRQMLQSLPSWMGLREGCRHPWRSVEPCVQIVLSALAGRHALLSSDPASLEQMCRFHPKEVMYLLNGIAHNVRAELTKALVKGVIHNFNARSDEDYQQNWEYFKSVLKANPFAKIVQFELSMQEDFWRSDDTPEEGVRRFLVSQVDWEAEIKKAVGEDVIVGHSWRFQDTLSAPVIHSVMMLDGPANEEIPGLLDMFEKVWRKMAGPKSLFFNTCNENSPFLYRGMRPDVAELYEKQNRIKHCAMYLVRTQAWLRLEMNVELAFGRIGKLSKSQNLRVMKGYLPNVVELPPSLIGAVGVDGGDFPWSRRPTGDLPFGANCGNFDWP